MDADTIIKLFIAIIGIVVGQTGMVFWRIGKMEGAIKKSQCPFGACPVFERAKTEAAPGRQDKV